MLISAYVFLLTFLTDDIQGGFFSCQHDAVTRDACLDAGVILMMSLFLRSAYFNAAFQALQVCYVVDGDIL